MIEDRGCAVGAMRSSTSFGMVMRSSASLAVSPLSIVTPGQRRTPSARAPAVEMWGASGLWGVQVADRDRDLDRRVEPFAPERYPGMRIAAHVELLRRAADEDRDRLEHELRIQRGLGGLDALRLGRFGGRLGGSDSLLLRLGVGLG